MSANDRLQKMQVALEQSGVRDVKFFFGTTLGDTPSSKVAEGVSLMLDAYLNKRYTPVQDIGDRAVTA